MAVQYATVTSDPKARRIRATQRPDGSWVYERRVNGAWLDQCACGRWKAVRSPRCAPCARRNRKP